MTEFVDFNSKRFQMEVKRLNESCVKCFFKKGLGGWENPSVYLIFRSLYFNLKISIVIQTFWVQNKVNNFLSAIFSMGLEKMRTIRYTEWEGYYYSYE